MDLFGETNLPRSEAPSRHFVKCLQPPQRNLPIRANVEPRHSENKPMQNIFQRIKGRKTFDRRVSHWMVSTLPSGGTRDSRFAF